jgi:glycosyltransferase involved in cell wall biosynthesis
VILEVSRTDATKRKDILLRAFAEVLHDVPEALLAVTIDDRSRSLHDDLLCLTAELGVADSVAVLGSVWDDLPCLYAVADVYCTPSVMEGFGMSAQEAAAAGTAVVASDLVPFATEYLLGDTPERVPVPGEGDLRVGHAGVVAPADSVPAFAAALRMLLGDGDLRARLGAAGRRVTVPDLTWDRLTAALLESVDA